jgi:hypothetical protein
MNAVQQRIRTRTEPMEINIGAEKISVLCGCREKNFGLLYLFEFKNRLKFSIKKRSNLVLA